MEPSGLSVSINLLSTWGDLFYIGMNGIEVLDPSGHRLPPPANIHAIPADINVLAGVANDPRRVSNLLDGNNAAADDYHCWLAPFVPDTPAVINLAYDKPITLGALRLWNYSKTPVRGVRQLQILLDGRLVFEGTVGQASTTVCL